MKKKSTIKRYNPRYYIEKKRYKIDRLMSEHPSKADFL